MKRSTSGARLVSPDAGRAGFCALTVAAAALGAARTRERSPSIRREETSSATTAGAPTASGGAPAAPSSATLVAPSSAPSVDPGGEPPPPPARCPGLARSIKATAVWKAGGPSGAMLVELRLPRSSRADVRYLRAMPSSLAIEGVTELHVPYGSRVVATTWTADGVTLTLLPDAGVGALGVFVPMGCAGAVERMEVELTLTGAPVAGKPVIVALYDSC